MTHLKEYSTLSASLHWTRNADSQAQSQAYAQITLQKPLEKSASVGTAPFENMLAKKNASVALEIARPVELGPKAIGYIVSIIVRS